MLIKLCFLNVLFQVLAVSAHLARVFMTLPMYKMCKKMQFREQ